VPSLPVFPRGGSATEPLLQLLLVLLLGDLAMERLLRPLLALLRGGLVMEPSLGPMLALAMEPLLEPTPVFLRGDLVMELLVVCLLLHQISCTHPFHFILRLGTALGHLNL